MKILLISPLGFPITPFSRYVGIERMVWEYSRQLVKDHDVTVMGHTSSEFPEGVKTLPITPQGDDVFSELKQYQTYQGVLRTFDVIHDWSHLHLTSRFMPNMPTLNIFFHAPALAQYPKAPYNIIALSQWAAREFKRVYHQEARYQYSVGIDPEVYKISKRHRGDRFLTIGRMAPEKGNLTAISYCQALGFPLDIVGGRGRELTSDKPLTDYEKAIQVRCDGKQIRLLGEVDDKTKIKLMQDCKALIYATDHPEVTSHKIQEAMLCGAPVIAPNIGAMPEIVTHGVNGYLCDRADGFLWAMRNIDKLDPMKIYAETVERFSIENTVKNYIPLYEKVADGLRWA